LAKRQGVSGIAEKASRTQVSVATNDADIALCLDIRKRVFVDEMGVPMALEQDGLDGDARHFLAQAQGAAIGAGRVRFPEPGLGKIERIAVLAEGRGAGAGDAIMRAILDDLAATGARKAALNAQTYAKGFYERLGFQAEGAEFMDADMPHIKMVKTLTRENL
jgi:ElaA protein